MAAPTVCDIVRGEVDRGEASVANALASYRDLAFQTQYSGPYFGTAAGARRSTLQSYADTIQQKEWQLRARYGAAAPTNIAWWRYGLCKTPASLAAQGLPYYNRAYLRAVAGYKPRPLLQLPAPTTDDAGEPQGGYAARFVDAVVPDGLAERMPLAGDRIAEPKLAVVLVLLLVVAFLAAITLVVYARKRAALRGLRRAAQATAGDAA